MKKVLLVLVLALMAFTAKAQVYVGGGLAAYFSNNIAVGIFPEVGYDLNDNMAVGMALGFQFGGGTVIAFDPYFRYYFAQLGPARFFADGNFNFNVRPGYTDPDDGFKYPTTTSWGIGIRPGVAIDLNSHLTLISHLGRLGYYGGTFSLGVNTGYSIGLLYSF